MAPNTSGKLLRILHYQRYIGVFLILIGIPIIIFVPYSNAAIPLMIGLFTLYASLEKTEDERSVSLKMSSLYIAFIMGYTLKLITSIDFIHALVPAHLTDINHFIILVFALALAIYYPRLYNVRE